MIHQLPHQREIERKKKQYRKLAQEKNKLNSKKQLKPWRKTSSHFSNRITSFRPSLHFRLKKKKKTKRLKRTTYVKAARMGPRFQYQKKYSYKLPQQCSNDKVLQPVNRVVPRPETSPMYFKITPKLTRFDGSKSSTIYILPLWNCNC